jgi:hypothetical protein
MRVNEVVNPLDRGAFSGLRNLGRSALNQFTRSQIGVDAYGDEEAAEFEKSAAEKQKKDQEQAKRQQQQTAAQQAARAIAQADAPAGSTAPQTAAANIQTVSPAVQPASAQTAPTPNFAQTNRVQYQPATTNAPTATVPNMPPRLPAANVNPAAKPVIYTLDDVPLNPNNPIHSRLIAQMQQQGITQARTKVPKK